MLVIMITEKRIDLGWRSTCFLFLKLFGGEMAGSQEYGSYKGHLSCSSKHEAGHLPDFKSGDGDCGCFMPWHQTGKFGFGGYLQAEGGVVVHAPKLEKMEIAGTLNIFVQNGEEMVGLSGKASCFIFDFECVFTYFCIKKLWWLKYAGSLGSSFKCMKMSQCTRIKPLV